MSKLDDKFAKMSREAANAMNGTHPPKRKTTKKSTTKRKSK